LLPTVACRNDKGKGDAGRRTADDGERKTDDGQLATGEDARPPPSFTYLKRTQKQRTGVYAPQGYF